MQLQPVHLRALLPWLASFTLLGLIDLWINGLMAGAGPFSYILLMPARAGHTLYWLQFSNLFEQLFGIVGDLYLNPIFFFPVRVFETFELIKNNKTEINVLFLRSLLIMNSAVIIALHLSLLRRLIRPDASELSTDSRPSLHWRRVILYSAIAASSVLFPTLYFWTQVTLQQAALTALWVGVAAMVVGVGLHAIRRRLWQSGAPDEVPTVMQKPSWIVPYFMAYAIIILLTAATDVAIQQYGQRFSGRLLGHEAATIRAWAAGIGVLFGVIGTLWGFRFNRASRDHVQAVFASSNLPDDNPLVERTRLLAARLGLPPPAVGVVSATNAFAVGPDQKTAAVVLGNPLVDMLTHDELNAVIGHELGHVVTADMQRLQMATGFESMFEGFVSSSAKATNAISRQVRSSEGRLGIIFTLLGLALVRWLVLLLAKIGVRAFSRAREYRADAVGAALTSPEAMISALEKVYGLKTPTSEAENRYGYLMFRPNASALFATHPPVHKRIEALRRGTYRLRLPELAGHTPVDPLSAGTAFGLVGQPSSALLSPVGEEPAPSSPTGFTRPSSALVTALSGPSRKAWWGLAAAALVIAAGGILVGNHLRQEQAKLASVSETITPRDQQLRAREATVTNRENALASREQGITANERRNSERAAAVDGRERQVQQREQEFEALRRNAGPEIARLQQQQEQTRNERQEMERQRTLLANERTSIEQLRRFAEQSTSNAAAERQRLAGERQQLEAERRNAGPEIANLQRQRDALRSERLMLEEQQRKISDERTTLSNQRQALDVDQQNAEQRIRDRESDLSRRENELEQRREQIVQEWNTVIGSAPGNIFNSVSIDQQGNFWWSVRKNSQRSARQEAEQRCNAESRYGNCQLMDFRNECVAISWSTPNGGWGSGRGPNRATAGAAAVRSCQSAGNPGCYTTPQHAWCDNGG